MRLIYRPMKAISVGHNAPHIANGRCDGCHEEIVSIAVDIELSQGHIKMWHECPLCNYRNVLLEKVFVETS
jgi:hypothetical protein